MLLGRPCTWVIFVQYPTDRMMGHLPLFLLTRKLRPTEINVPVALQLL